MVDNQPMLNDYVDMAYNGPLSHIFISYSHADFEKVVHILRYMYHDGLRFWYDRGIMTGDEWKDTIDQRLNSSCRFLLFLSNGTEQRSEVIRELRTAISLCKERPDYRVYVVLLERMPLSHVFRQEPEILAFLQKVQFISLYRYRLTTQFLETLLNPRLWPQAVIDEALRGLHLPLPELNQVGKAPDTFQDVQEDNPYIYQKVFPVRCQSEGIAFYTLEIGETDPLTAYPLCIDNQWCPVSFYDDPDFQAEGFQSQRLSAIRIQLQQREIFRALLHHWQVLVNRASIFNSTVFQAWYGSEGNDQKAFFELLENGSIVIYLMREKSPFEAPVYDHDERLFAAWQRACQAAPVFCIRMDWQDDAHNAAMASRSLAARFRTLLLTTSEDQNLLDTFCDAMKIPCEQQFQFRQLWAQVRDAVIAGSKDKITNFNREQVYRQFLLRNDGSPVTDCKLDYSRPFVKELKHIVDFVYMLNLPQALMVQPMVGYEEPLWDYVLSERLHQRHYRTLNWDEVYCAILAFSMDFLKNKLPHARHPERLTLSGLNRLRALPSWRSYMEAVEAGRKRARLNEIDFQDIHSVWLRCQKWLCDCAETETSLDWAMPEGSLSLIYHLGNDKVIAVYSLNPEKQKLYADEEAWFSNQSQGVITIDYICGDMLTAQNEGNCFLSPVRLFEGLIAEPARQVRRKLMATLKLHFQTMNAGIANDV